MAFATVAPQHWFSAPCGWEEGDMNSMTLGTSTFLVAVGAIMRYAVSARADTWNVPMVGGILMIVGFVGALISLALFVTANKRRRAIGGTQSTINLEEREVR